MDSHVYVFIPPGVENTTHLSCVDGILVFSDAMIAEDHRAYYVKNQVDELLGMAKVGERVNWEYELTKLGMARVERYEILTVCPLNTEA